MIRLSPLVLVLLLAACTKNDRQQAPSPPPAPSAMTDPNDITKVSFDTSLHVDLATMERLPNGVFIKELRQGTGDEAKSHTQVQIHYRGRLPNALQFDANQAPQPPLQFRVDNGEVVPGFDWAVKGMKVGGQRLAIIPPSLGYGAQPYGPLPANAVLVFVLDLVDVKP